MFDLFIIVEEAYRAEVDLGKLNILDWFERSMETLGVLVKENKFNPTICCDTHRKELVEIIWKLKSGLRNSINNQSQNHCENKQK
ncbi:hypothetical protein OUZ56_002873 [Daphnia magna]|uniref:Uncharacterized protein n=1 Tax=Daphnia magna TaxID=35525 RepID=A0ABR0A7D0_9CRUS|nr:hypothetical protein OUZ56_002873 [Daphnia magna]